MNNRQVSVGVTVSYLNADSAVTVAKHHGANEEVGWCLGALPMGLGECGGHCAPYN